MPIAQFSHPSQIVRMVKAHSPRALHDRFENDRGNGCVVFGDQRLEGCKVRRIPGLMKLHPRPVGEEMRGQYAPEKLVHAGDGVAYGHGLKRIAVIAAADRQQFRFGRQPLSPPILRGHFNRHLHGHGSGVREEDLFQPRWRQRQQFAPQIDGRFMGDAAKHHMGHVLHLRVQRGVQLWVVVTVNRRPPGRHAVDQLFAAGEPEAHAAGARDRVNRQRRRRRGVRMPQMIAIEVQIVCAKRPTPGHRGTPVRARPRMTVKRSPYKEYPAGCRGPSRTG